MYHCQFLNFICMHTLLACMCTTCVPGVHRGQKRVKEAGGSPGTRVKDGCEPPCVLGIEPGSSVRATSALNY